MEEVVKQVVPVISTVLQNFIMLLIGYAIKLHRDVKKNRRDLNQAFKKIRELETCVKRNQETVEPSKAGCRESTTQ